MGQFHDEFLSDVRSFIADTGMKASTLGREAVGDPCFVSELEGGRRPRRATVQHVREFMASKGWRRSLNQQAA